MSIAFSLNQYSVTSVLEAQQQCTQLHVPFLSRTCSVWVLPAFTFPLWLETTLHSMTPLFLMKKKLEAGPTFLCLMDYGQVMIVTQTALLWRHHHRVSQAILASSTDHSSEAAVHLLYNWWLALMVKYWTIILEVLFIYITAGRDTRMITYSHTVLVGVLMWVQWSMCQCHPLYSTAFNKQCIA